MELLVPLGDSTKGGWIIWVPLQGTERREPGGPDIPHHIQHSGIRSPPDLGIHGESN